MLGRLGRRDNGEGLKEQLIMLVVQPVFKYYGEAPVGSNFGAGGVCVSSCDCCHGRGYAK